MADQQYRRPSSPVHARRGHSDASISLSPFGGSVTGSALGRSSDLLGLPGPTSMPYDYSVPRLLSSTSDDPSRGSNTLYNTGLYLDGNSDGQQQASASSAITWPVGYSLQSGDATTAASSAIPIHRFQIEPEPSWTPLKAAPPRLNSGTSYAQQKHGQRPGSNNHCPPGPGSDLVSRTNETDEGYYTNSQPDAHSVHSMSAWIMKPERQNMQNTHTLQPSVYFQPGRENATSEQPNSDLQHQPTIPDHAAQSQQRQKSLVCEAEDCKHEARTQSEFKKHAARHNKEHVCREPDCLRKEGFATINDLERHQKSVHKIQPEHGKSKEYKCFGESCSKHDKEWPRFDNFKQHLKRMHEKEDIEMLINKSNKWYEQHKKSQLQSTVRAPQRPSSSNSLLATSHTEIQTEEPCLTQGHHNQSVTTNESPVAATGVPGRTLGVTYPQSEAGIYTTSSKGSSNTFGVTRPSEGHVQFQLKPVPCLFSACSQALLTPELCTRHMYLQHGYQNRDYSEMQPQGSSWHRSQSNSKNQPAISYVPVQRSASNAERLQPPYQSQTRLMNSGHGPRTAPNPSIQTVQNRLAEDFDNSAIMPSQEPFFAAGSSDIILAQIGMMDDFQPGVSQTNLGFDNSQEQDLNVQDDQQKKPTSPLSLDAVKSFLREHVPHDRIELAASMIQGTLQSLQSTSSSRGVNSISPPPSKLDADELKPSTRNGKLSFSCPFPKCDKYTSRRCELRKHLQRHTLPWACTFDKCRKRFGSKNDWKRHETKQHEQQEAWRCEELQTNTSGRSTPASGDAACMKLFCTKELYLKHLADQHRITDSSVGTKLCTSQRIGAKCKGQYWCGFCNKIITMERTGFEGDNERYNHIDHHFIKEGCTIEEWKALDGRPSPGDNVMVSESTSPATSSCMESDEGEGNGEDAAGAHASQIPFIPQSIKKRPASTMAGGNGAPVPKVARSTSKAHRFKTHMITCCNCGNIFSQWNASCIDCSHRVCNHCLRELVKQREV